LQLPAEHGLERRFWNLHQWHEFLQSKVWRVEPLHLSGGRSWGGRWMERPRAVHIRSVCVLPEWVEDLC
jgi:hypothetical protein